jgi:hypothetical protein
VINPLQDYWFLLRRDPTSETSAQRDSNSLSNFRLDPLGRRSNKLLRSGIQQQHRHCVDLKQPSHPLQQLSQEILNIEVGQRRVGHRLNPTPSIISGRHVTRLVQRGHDQDPAAIFTII